MVYFYKNQNIHMKKQLNFCYALPIKRDAFCLSVSVVSGLASRAKLGFGILVAMRHRLVACTTLALEHSDNARRQDIPQIGFFRYQVMKEPPRFSP